MVKQETLPCLARAVVLIDENYFAFHVPELKTFPETFNRRIEQEQGQHAGQENYLSASILPLPAAPAPTLND